jgi:hypothetical protein
MPVYILIRRNVEQDFCFSRHDVHLETVGVRPGMQIYQLPGHGNIKTLPDNDCLLSRNYMEHTAASIVTTAAANSSVTTNRKITVNSK